MESSKQDASAATEEPSRRGFFKRAAVAAGGMMTAGALCALAAHKAFAAEDDHGRDGFAGRPGGPGRRGDYGDLRPAEDRDGRVVLALPKGFQYCTFSSIGERFGEGQRVALNHDGMACFPGRGNIVRLIRNHEVRNAAGDFTLGVNGPAHLRYDAKAAGGCMTLHFDTRHKRLVRQFISINGTYVNCSGGFSLNNAGWITSEETTAGIGQGFEKPHGYNFLVPAAADSTVPALALKAMGRFAHEASVADDRGIVYQTEDSGNNSGFYRFLPAAASDLRRGGKLQMLAVKRSPTAAMYSGQAVGQRQAVEWVEIADPDPPLEASAPTCFQQGRSRGGAAFNRLEGLYRGEDGRSMYFLSTSGGDPKGPGSLGYGQLWRYLPADGMRRQEDQLVLVFQSPSGSVLEAPDNLCLTPGGGVLICEDDAVNDADRHPQAGVITDVNRLIGLSAKGVPFTFAVNLLNDSEFAGACFSPDGEILFVNVFGNGTPGSGMTCAIWGPWSQGPL